MKSSLQFIFLIMSALFSCGAYAGIPDPQCDTTSDFYAKGDKRKEMLLIAASAGGRVAEIRQLLIQKTSPNYSDEEMMTPLSWAARCGHLEAVKTLIENGANINQRVSFQVNSRYRNKNSSALIWAAQGGHADIVLYLMSMGADPLRREKVYRLIYTESGEVTERFFRVGRRADEVTNNKEIISILHRGRKSNPQGL